MATGKVVRYEGKGWGFIRPDDGGRDVFMHVADVAPGDKERIRAGDQVSYDVVEGDRGPRAVRVRIAGGRPEPARAVTSTGYRAADDESADYLTVEEYGREVGLILDEAAVKLQRLARQHGWVE